MPRRKRHADAVGAKMDLTPMIDVTFQLLIFFLVATKFKELERRLDSFLPRDGHSVCPPPAEPPPEPLVLAVGTAGNPAAPAPRITVGTETIAAAAPGGDEAFWMRVRDRVAAGRARFGPEAKTLISADERAPWEFVALTLNACLQAGCPSVAFSAAPPDWGR